MQSMQALFDAHTPQPGYLARFCDHFYCGFLSVAELIQSPAHVVKPFAHAHAPYEFLLPLTPIPLIVQNDAVYFGEVGYAYPIQSGRQHATALENSDIANYNITINEEVMNRRLTEKGLAGAEFNARFPVSQELSDYIKLLKTEFSKGAAADRNDLDALGSLIVSNIIELGCRPQADRRKPAREYQKGMSAVFEYINANFEKELSMDELAAMSGFSRNHFGKSFKKMYGEAPYAHITKLRLSKAKILLENTDLPISQIAAECGFAKSNAFANLFKAESGQTPTQFRAERKRQSR